MPVSQSNIPTETNPGSSADTEQTHQSRKRSGQTGPNALFSIIWLVIMTTLAMQKRVFFDGDHPDTIYPRLRRRKSALWSGSHSRVGGGSVAMNQARARPLAFVVGLVASLLLAVSLFLPVATAHQTQGLTVIGGWELLFTGPLAPMMGQFGWYATPCLLYTIVLLLGRRAIGRRRALVLMLAMSVLLMDALSWRNYPNDGGDGPIVHFGSGYFLWIAAVVLGVIGVLLARATEAQLPSKFL